MHCKEHDESQCNLALEKIDQNLMYNIEKYIDDYNLSSPCMVNVQLVKFKYNYTVFNITTDFSRDFKFSSVCIKSKNGVVVCFYSGIENYIKNFDNRISNINKNCIDAGMIVVVDSAGIWNAYSNIGLLPSCEIPDIKELLAKSKIK